MTSGRYDRLVEFWRNEREKKELQQIPEKFYRDMTEYLSKMQEQTRMIDKTSLKGKLSLKEKEYAEKMIEELSRLRMRKIIESELNGVALASKNLTLDEQAFYSELRGVLSVHEERLKSILMGRASHVDAKPSPRVGLKVIRFLKAVPAIIGIDMKTYGPFQPEDVVSIPVENAENLIRRGIAKEVEIPE